MIEEILDKINHRGAGGRGSKARRAVEERKVSGSQGKRWGTGWDKSLLIPHSFITLSSLFPLSFPSRRIHLASRCTEYVWDVSPSLSVVMGMLSLTETTQARISSASPGHARPLLISRTWPEELDDSPYGECTQILRN